MTDHPQCASEKLPSPNDNNVAHVLATVRARVGQLLARRQLEPEDDSTLADPLTETSAVLAGLVSASPDGLFALTPGPAPASAASATGRTSCISPLLATRTGPTSTASTYTPTPGSPTRPVPPRATRPLSPPRPPRAQDRLPPRGRALVETQDGVARWHLALPL